MRERPVLEALLGAYVAALLVPAAALVSAHSGGDVPGTGPLVATFVALAVLVAIATRGVENLANSLASLLVVAGTILPPFAYLPYVVFATSPGSPEAFVAIVGILSILPGIAVPVGSAVVRNRRLRAGATEVTVVTVGGDEADEGRNWAVVASVVAIGLAFVVYGAIALLEGDIEGGSMIGTMGGLSSSLVLLAGDDETEVAVTDAGLRIDRSFVPWEGLEGYRLTDEAVELLRTEWYYPTRSFEREEVGEEKEDLIEALGRFLPRLDEDGRVEQTPREGQPRDRGRTS